MTTGTLSLRDIAELAQVQRAVVSMWRRRPRAAGIEVPFPAPVATDGRSERFSRDEIVAWLEATGRGNNPQVRLDAPGIVAPEGADVEDVVALVCLSALTGEELTGQSQDELADLAEQADGDDQFLLREVRSLKADSQLLIYVDDLIEASFGPADALDRAESGHLGRQRANRGVTPELVALVRAVVTGARMYFADDQVLLVPPDDPQLTTGIMDGFAGLRIDGDDQHVRALRRRLAIRSIDTTPNCPSVVRVLSVIGKSASVALEAMDNMALDLNEREVGVIVGPANLLCDPLTGEAEQERTGTLRLGKLAIALRLPRGLWREAHRQHLAVWVLRGGESMQRFRVADLEGESLALEDLTSDVVGALEQSEDRAYRYARSTDLRPILARGPVVPRGTRAVRFGTTRPATCLDRVQAARLTTSETIPGYDVAVVAGPGQIVLRHRSLGELELAKVLIMRRGRKLDPGLAVPAGTVRVLSADGRTDGVRLDPFDAARVYGRATRTEPGDVVFIDRPCPVAVVDPDGGALVASPSRILRLLPGAPLGPHALAALINELAPAGTDWQTWAVPDLQPTAAEALDTALTAAFHHLSTLRAHEQAIQDLTRNLINGVATGAVTIDTTIRKAG